MMTITKTAANRVEIDWTGSLDTDAMQTALDDLVATSADVTNGQLLYRIHAFEMPTMGAIAAEFARMPQLLGLIAKFDRCAVLTDTPWLRTAAEIEGALFPTLTIKAFALDDTTAANLWLNGEDEADTDADAENYPV